jgi:histone H3/H4
MVKEISTAAIERLLKTSGAKRVSEDSKKALQKILKKRIFELSQKASTFSKHAGRKTLKKEDLVIAADT